MPRFTRLLIFAFALFTQLSSAQFNYSWSQLSDGTSGEYGNFLLRDENDFSILVGAFTGTLYLGQGTQIDTVENVDQMFTSQDIYIQSISPKGIHKWVRSIGAVDLMVVNDVFLQPGTGNIVLCGTFSGPVDFDPGTGVVSKSPMTNFADSYVLILDSQGNFVDVFTFATPMANAVRSMAALPSGNFFVAGVFTDSIDLDHGPTKSMLYSTSSFHSYLAKYDVDGEFLWAKQFPDQEFYIESIQSRGEVLSVVGRFTDTINIAFPPATATAIAEPYSNSLMSVSYDTLGTYLNHRSFDMLGNTAMGGGSHMASIYAHALSPAGDIYLGTSFGGQLRLDSMQTLSSPGAYRALVLKLDSTNDLAWAREFGGLGGANNAAQDRVEVIDFYDDGTLMVAGNFTGPEDLDPTAGTQIMGSLVSGLQAYVAKWRTDGSFIAVRHWDASISSTINDGYAHGNNTYVCGVYRGWMDMDFGPGVVLDTAFSLNAHVMELGCEYLLLDTLTGVDSIIYQNQTYRDSGLWLYDTLTAQNLCDSIHGVLLSISPDTTSDIGVWEDDPSSALKVYPNPTSATVQVQTDTFTHFSLYAPTGNLLQKGRLEGQVSLKAYPPGMYLLRLESEGESRNVRILKSR